MILGFIDLRAKILLFFCICKIMHKKHAIGLHISFFLANFVPDYEKSETLFDGRGRLPDGRRHVLRSRWRGDEALLRL